MLSYHPIMHEMLGKVPSATAVGKPLVRNRANSSTNLLATAAASAALSLQAGRHPILGEVYNDNINHFACLTSGFHSVNDSFLWKHVQTIRQGDGNQYKQPYLFLETMINEGQITREYDDLMSEFYDAYQARDTETQDRVESIIFLRKIAEIWNLTITQSYPSLIREIRSKVDWLYEEYLMKHQPGDAIPKYACI